MPHGVCRHWQANEVVGCLPKYLPEQARKLQLQRLDVFSLHNMMVRMQAAGGLRGVRWVVVGA
jgi:hypothetical protein